MIYQPVAFKILMEIVNAILAILNENGYKIYDAENTEYFISKVRYDKEDDKIKFDVEE